MHQRLSHLTSLIPATVRSIDLQAFPLLSAVLVPTSKRQVCHGGGGDPHVVGHVTLANLAAFSLLDIVHDSPLLKCLSTALPRSTLLVDSAPLAFDEATHRVPFAHPGVVPSRTSFCCSTSTPLRYLASLPASIQVARVATPTPPRVRACFALLSSLDNLRVLNPRTTNPLPSPLFPSCLLALPS
ncbi:hypothetical protein MSAN_02430400 [Mycena sanguinolenta]|uniref:Uncharacterized protein n=1 Tax=Mycena sanguinolenta TaxID=230812 RepID=A0A8H6X309_9AGAR|nr:hypothetical protein MSAN_02430400 [Mycena sanguinolenta]